MKHPPFIFAGWWVCCLVVVGLIPGCQPPPAKATKEPVIVTVFQPVLKPDVVDYIYFTGHARSYQMVDVKPRVSGYLEHIVFQNGGSVRGPSFKSSAPQAVAGAIGQLRSPVGVSTPLFAATMLCLEGVEGDLLFEIDPRLYQAAYDLAASQVDLAKAKFVSATAVYQLNLDAYNSGQKLANNLGKGIVVISPQALVTYQAAMVEAEAAWHASQASLESARLDLQFTRVHAPVNGKITYNFLTRGNLVTKDVTSLARISGQNPMYVYFDIDEQSVQELQLLQRSGAFTHIKNTPVWAGLSKDKDQYPLEGTLDYIDPEVDPTMGTRTYRALFNNPPTNYLLGGNFVRVKLSKGKAPYPAPIVPDKSLVAEQGNKYLLVCDANNKVRKELVKLGALVDNGLRVILAPDNVKIGNQEWAQRWVKEWVILDGVGEAQDKGDVVVSKRYRLKLDDGTIQELK